MRESRGKRVCEGEGGQGREREIDRKNEGEKERGGEKGAYISFVYNGV